MTRLGRRLPQRRTTPRPVSLVRRPAVGVIAARRPFLAGPWRQPRFAPAPGPSPRRGRVFRPRAGNPRPGLLPLQALRNSARRMARRCPSTWRAARNKRRAASRSAHEPAPVRQFEGGAADLVAPSLCSLRRRSPRCDAFHAGLARLMPSTPPWPPHAASVMWTPAGGSPRKRSVTVAAALLFGRHRGWSPSNLKELRQWP